MALCYRNNLQSKISYICKRIRQNNDSFKWYPVKLETKTTCISLPDGDGEIETNAMTFANRQTDRHDQ